MNIHFELSVLRYPRLSNMGGNQKWEVLLKNVLFEECLKILQEQLLQMKQGEYDIAMWEDNCRTIVLSVKQWFPENIKELLFTA